MAIRLNFNETYSGDTLEIPPIELAKDYEDPTIVMSIAKAFDQQAPDLVRRSSSQEINIEGKILKVNPFSLTLASGKYYYDIRIKTRTNEIFTIVVGELQVSPSISQFQ